MHSRPQKLKRGDFKGKPETPLPPEIVSSPCGQAEPTLVRGIHPTTQTAGMRMLRPIHLLQQAMAVFAVLAALSAHYGFSSAYAVLKPLPMVWGMACVWFLARPSRDPMAWDLLLLALLLSMVGDICLLFERSFVLGLGAFLCAHLAYLGVLRRETPQWLPSKAAFVLCALLGAELYGYLWFSGLPAALRVPVFAYVCVIVCMAAQAMGRALHLRTTGSWCVAAGAISFMASDSLLAISKFVTPLPATHLWVLGSYYLAQWLIVHGMLRAVNQKPELSAHAVSALDAKKALLAKHGCLGQSVHPQFPPADHIAAPDAGRA